MMLELNWGQHVAVEVDGLYRPLNAKDVMTRSDGSAASDGRRFMVLTWEFSISSWDDPCRTEHVEQRSCEVRGLLIYGPRPEERCAFTKDRVAKCEWLV